MKKQLLTSLCLVVASSVLLPASQAQQVYRIVGADGKVTFSDQPPPASSKSKSGASYGPSSQQMGVAALPYELKQAVSKYPVTLYVGENCAPCGSGRSLLTSRGIPFTEKTVTTADDAQALQRLSGETALPLLTIGNQQLKGFADAEWAQYLSAAGYPPASVLPPSYRRPEPTPLVSIAPASTGIPPASAPSTSAVARPALPNVQPNNNPAGIKF